MWRWRELRLSRDSAEGGVGFILPCFLLLYLPELHTYFLRVKRNCKYHLDTIFHTKQKTESCKHHTKIKTQTKVSSTRALFHTCLHVLEPNRCKRNRRLCQGTSAWASASFLAVAATSDSCHVGQTFTRPFCARAFCLLHGQLILDVEHFLGIRS